MHQEEMMIKYFFIQGQGNLASGRDAEKRFFQGQENLASGSDAEKRFFFKKREILHQEEMLIKKKSRTGKSCFRKRC